MMITKLNCNICDEGTIHELKDMYMVDSQQAKVEHWTCNECGSEKEQYITKL